MDDKNFKMTPPDYDTDDVEKRMKIEMFLNDAGEEW